MKNTVFYRTISSLACPPNMLFRLYWITDKLRCCGILSRKILVMKLVPCCNWYCSSCGLRTGGSWQSKQILYGREPLKEARKSGRDRLHVDFNKIQKRLAKSGVEVSKSQIEENWKLLKNVGCLDDHLYCYPKILGVQKYELLTQIGRLYALGCDQISVGLLRLARIYTKKLETRVNKYLDDEFNFTATAMGILGCNQAQLDSLLDRNPQALEMVALSARRLQDKVALMYKNGYTAQDIVRYPEMLRLSHKRLSAKMDLVHQIGLKQLPDLGMLDHHKFEDYLQRKHDSGKLHDESYKLSKFAEMFKVEEDSVLLTRQLKDTSMVLTKNKLAILEEAGYRTRDVMCKPIILYYSEDSIKQAVEYIKVKFPDHIGDLNYIGNVLQDTVYRKNKSVSYKLIKHIASCLDVDFSSFSMTQIQLFGVVSISTVNENMKYLKKNEFSISDIQSCPLILVQEPDIVKKCLYEAQNLENFKHFKEDKIKLLNAVQYLIEFDSKPDHDE